MTTLTPFEVRVLKMAAEGKNCRVMSKELNKSLDSTQQISETMKKKLGARTIAHAVAIGIRERVIEA